MLSDDDAFALKFSSVAKSLKTLVDVEAANNTAIANAIQIAFAKELEAQNQDAERRDQLFDVLEKFNHVPL
uniref:Uncharacterized protein n=1 Tax=Setaria italica TaxID=4555 RepID=K3Y0M7_SETIT